MFLPGHGGMQMCEFKLHAEESPRLTLASAREGEKSGNASLLRGPIDVGLKLSAP
jgi:hypothetical protein